MKTKTVGAITKSVQPKQRIVEQIVSVFGNVDHVGDQVKMGAFKGTIERWGKSDGPLPAVFSHQWANPAAIIGDVKDIEELPPGHAQLPDKVKDLGGLFAQYSVDDRPFADDVLHQLEKKRIRQASFAYDTNEEEWDKKAGINHLIDLELIEVGPTLRGANSATDLISAKSLWELKEALGANSHHPFLPSKDESSVCGYPDCGRGQRATVHIDRISDIPKSLEALLATLSELTLNVKAIVDVYGTDITKLSKAYESEKVKAEDETKSDSEDQNTKWLMATKRYELLKQSL